MTLKHETINQPSFLSVRLAPSYSQNKEDALALQVLQEIISGGPTTRLYKNLVVEQKKAVSVGFSYNSSALNETTIWLSAAPAEDVSLEEIENLVFQEIKNIIGKGVTQTEVSDAIQRLQDAAVFALDSVSGPAMIMGQELTTGSEIDDVEFWPENIEKITAQDIQHVAKTYLDNNNPWKRQPITAYLQPLDETNSEEVTP